MAHGITLLMRAIRKPPPKYIHRHGPLGNKTIFSLSPTHMPYRNPARNTGLSRREQIAARRGREA